MTLVKICGVSEPRHARAAAACGADLIGVVFAPSQRQVTLGQATRIAEALGERAGPPAAATVEAVEERLRAGRPLLVGVFADQDADTINAIAGRSAWTSSSSPAPSPGRSARSSSGRC